MVALLPKTTKKIIPKKKCPLCGKEKSTATGFYKTASPLYPDGTVPICISCVKKDVVNEDGTVNIKKLKTMCQRLDKPFYTDDLNSAYEQTKTEHGFTPDEEIAKMGNQIVGFYFKNINSLRQTKNKSYADSEKDGFIHQNSNTTKADKVEILNQYDDSRKQERNHNRERKQEDVIYVSDEDFEVTNEMITLFGDGYSPTLYKKMQDKYDKLKINYTLQTNIHQEALATYVRFKVQEELATAKGDVTEAKKWYDAAQSSAQDAKLTPKQLTKADLDGGVTSMSELTKALEQAVDVIKILPRFKYRPNDAVDFNIWCYVDYERRLNDKPDVPYEDVYKFYDEKKRQYIKQNGDPYGIFDNDPTEKNRDTVKTFIKLPEDYDDLGGEDNDN